MEEMKTPGERIRYVRKLKDMSQSELGEFLGRGQSAVYAWESGESFPRVPELIKLAELGETTIDWICIGTKAVNEGDPISEAAIEVARLYDACLPKHREKILVLASACYRDSIKKNGNSGK